NSGVASTCVNMKTRFLMGGGFADKVFYKQKVNRKGLTVDKLLRKVSENMAKLPMVGIHINYNALYKKTEAHYIPFDHIRLTDCENEKHRNMVALYDDWQKIKRSRIEKDKISYLHFYNPDPKVIQQQVDEAGGWGNYKGQVLFYSPDGFEYPLADYDSVLEDMQTDSKAKSFKFRNITNNFMASHILVTDKIEDDGVNQGNKERFLESIEQFQGADDALRILHMEKTSNESTIELKKIEIQDVESLYEYTERSVKENIILSFLIPPVLLLKTQGNSIGESKEIENATAYYNGITYHERLIIEELFKEVFTNFSYDINPSGNYEIIPFKAPVSKPSLSAEYFPYVTKNQILESIGLPEVVEATANVKPMYEALGVGGLQALTALLADATLTPIQKQNALTIIFKLSLDDAIKLSGGGAI
ncbi:MAG: hypothetical protein V4549_17915, partial [Bacteroidota bacterium]